MKIEWIEEKFPELSGETGAFTRAAGRHGSKATAVNANTPVKMKAMVRTCHGDLVPAPSAAMGM
jgi:hypothetical protein